MSRSTVYAWRKVDLFSEDIVGSTWPRKAMLGGPGARSARRQEAPGRLHPEDRARSKAASRLGPEYTAHQFLGELRWLGIRSTPAYVREPEGFGSTAP